MAEAFERVLFDAAHSDLTIEDEKDPEDNDEKMDVDWNVDCEKIETRSSSLFIDFGGEPIPIEQLYSIGRTGGADVSRMKAEAEAQVDRQLAAQESTLSLPPAASSLRKALKKSYCVQRRQ
ncbi:hypothetical protein Y032_0120g929 [Ancylostoma ceylanicum]|uniref:Uncharacterized protein n=1 Tax=Ancylostoma ceylanicum TaxID=53326 RepID=A0A016T9X2_9BILA|nr:hypothetical protein Y032_0120g929 [Ancylostoma ceylanicum]